MYYIHIFTNPVKNLTHKLEAEQNLSVKYTTGRRMRAQHSHSCMKRFGSFRWLCDSLIYLWLLGARSASYTGHCMKVKEIELRKHSSYARGARDAHKFLPPHPNQHNIATILVYQHKLILRVKTLPKGIITIFRDHIKAWMQSIKSLIFYLWNVNKLFSTVNFHVKDWMDHLI